MTFAQSVPLLLVMAAGCGDDDGGEPLPPVANPLVAALEADGPFGVGYRIVQHSYESPAGTRNIELHLWYPSEAPAGETAIYELLFTDDDVFVDAPLGRTPFAGGFPVLVHSHGHQGFPGNSADLMHHFATHGWVAVAPTHTDNTLSDAIDPLPTRHYFERPLDIRAALDALGALPAGDPLAGLCDLSRVAMSGHSFGSYTSWVSAGAAFDQERLAAACAMGELPEGGCTAAELAVFEEDLSEPRIAVAIPMANGQREIFFGQDGYDAIDVPVLLMTGSADEVGAQALWDLVGDEVPFSWIDIAGGCHQAFGLGGCAELPDDVGFPIINAYALAFARRYALGDQDARVLAIVAGDDTVSDLVTFQAK